MKFCDLGSALRKELNLGLTEADLAQVSVAVIRISVASCCEALRTSVTISYSIPKGAHVKTTTMLPAFSLLAIAGLAFPTQAAPPIANEAVTKELAACNSKGSAAAIQKCMMEVALKRANELKGPPKKAAVKAPKTLGPGLGFSKATPAGPTFALPAGLKLENPIIAWSPENPVDCDDKFKDESYGTGEEVRVCLIFQNTTNVPINVTLPPGLMFVSTNDDVQNGIIVQTISVVVPAGERFFAPIGAYCANQDRSTTGNDDRYVLGPVVQDRLFQEVFSLLTGKRLSREQAGRIQIVVDHVSQGEGLSASDRAFLQSL